MVRPSAQVRRSIRRQAGSRRKEDWKKLDAFRKRCMATIVQEIKIDSMSTEMCQGVERVGCVLQLYTFSQSTRPGK